MWWKLHVQIFDSLPDAGLTGVDWLLEDQPPVWCDLTADQPDGTTQVHFNTPSVPTQYVFHVWKGVIDKTQAKEVVCISVQWWLTTRVVYFPLKTQVLCICSMQVLVILVAVSMNFVQLKTMWPCFKVPYKCK